MNSIDPNEVISHPAFPGIIGALVGLKFVPGKTWFERFYNLTSSCAIVWFGAPAAIEFFSMTTEGMRGLTSFLLGLFGLSLAKAIFSGISETRLGEIATGWLSRKG
jgi:hypothetical protein